MNTPERRWLEVLLRILSCEWAQVLQLESAQPSDVVCD